MRGRIMREENGKFYILTQKGDFVSADAVSGFKCGDEIEVKNEIIPSHMIKPIASIAAAIVIVLGGLYGYHVPVRYVDVCINPEIQLSLNALDRVIEVQGKNDDGVRIAKANNVRNERVNDAIDDIVQSARQMGYMDKGEEDERDVIVSVYGDGAVNLSAKLDVENVRVVEKSDYEKARKADIPVGKYVLMNELSRVDENMDMDRIKNMSVKQIIDKIDDVKNAASTPTPTPVQTAEPTVVPEPTPEVTEAPTETVKPTAVPTRKPVTTAKKTTKVNKTTASSSKKTTATVKATAVSKNTTAKTTASTKVAAKSTPSPTLKPTAVSTAKPDVTPLPSFNKVTRPAANTPMGDTADKSDNKNTPAVSQDKLGEDKVPQKNANAVQQTQPSGNAQSGGDSERNVQRNDSNSNGGGMKLQSADEPKQNGFEHRSNTSTENVQQSGGQNRGNTAPSGGNTQNRSNTAPQGGDSNRNSASPQGSAPVNTNTAPSGSGQNPDRR